MVRNHNAFHIPTLKAFTIGINDRTAEQRNEYFDVRTHFNCIVFGHGEENSLLIALLSFSKQRFAWNWTTTEIRLQKKRQRKPFPSKALTYTTHFHNFI